jgi:hypothetical protein
VVNSGIRRQDGGRAMSKYRAKVVQLGRKFDELNATYDEQLDA